MGLAKSFKIVDFKDLHFIWLVNEGDNSWLTSNTPICSEILTVPSKKNIVKPVAQIKFLIRKIYPLHYILNYIRYQFLSNYSIPEAPPIIQKVDYDLIHFPVQFGFKTSRPNIYQPHDLQHFHLPKNFTKLDILFRKKIYLKMMQQASVIVVGTNWTKIDVQNYYPDYAQKICNIPVWCEPLVQRNSYEDFINPGEYIFYPAMNWPHKNHFRLVEAFAEVVRSGLNLKLILSGSGLESNKDLHNLIRDKNLNSNVKIVGLVSTADLFLYYKHAKLVVVPSLFESESLPIWEAFTLGVPVVASNIPTIVDQVQNAAVLFDPLSITSIASEISYVLSNPEIQLDLVNKGFERIKKFTAENSALGYRLVYRKASNLSEDYQDKNWQEDGFRF